MTAKEVFLMLAVAHGSFILGVLIFIFYYYIPKRKNESKNMLRWHIVSVATSYILLTIATIKTSAVGIYEWGDAWYWIVFIAYISGDISLLYVFKSAVRKYKLDNLSKKL